MGITLSKIILLYSLHQSNIGNPKQIVDQLDDYTSTEIVTNFLTDNQKTTFNHDFLIQEVDQKFLKLNPPYPKPEFRIRVIALPLHTFALASGYY